MERLRILFGERGFRLIGDGHFSNVYSNGRNVIKVYRNDPSYERFLDYVNQHPNIHFPKIINQPRNLKGTDLKVVQLERLLPVSNENWFWFEKALMHIFVSKSEMRDDLHDLYQSELSFADYNPQYGALVSAIRGLETIEGVTHDFQMQNILQRPDGTIVISDPFC